MSDEKKLELFIELEPKLIIDSTKRQISKIESLEKEKTELEKKNIELVKYMKKVDELIADKERMENSTK